MNYKCKACEFETEAQIECTCGSPMKIVLSIKTKIFIALGAVLLILILWRASFALEFVKTIFYTGVFFSEKVQANYMFESELYAEDDCMAMFFDVFFNMKKKRFKEIKLLNKDQINDIKLQINKLDDETTKNQLK